ncbi:MAG TPA: hypothetical protein VG166_12800 [Caulobacteraceae bacterium]|jgi:hypothetical protein|nr:hypothetical protein [Caulobacteraceae bacterium]
MRHARLVAIATLAWAVASGAWAAGQPAGVVAEPAYVAAVEVAPDPAAPTGFAEALRAAVLKEAALYGATGLPLTVKIDLNRVHLKNPVQTLVVGDDDMARGWVQVLDPATGRRLGVFQVAVDARRGGGNGARIAVGVAGFLDPTGLVSLGATVATIDSTAGGRGRAEAMMTGKFALETLRQTFGDDKARAVHGLKPK